MTNAEIIKAIRRGIREHRPVTVDDDAITAVILRGVTIVGLKILQSDPSFFNTRKSVASAGNIYVFDKPSDCLTIEKVWDLGANAKTITGAADNGLASGYIRITSAAHGFDDDEIVFIHDVAGCTEANGTWKVDNSATNTFDLMSSTFTNAYTSGGKAYADPSDPDEITKISMAEADLSHSNRWYPRKDMIIVDDNGFANDIMLDYIALPTAIADIDSGYHEWLVSYGITDLMHLDYKKIDEYYDKVAVVRHHEGRLAFIDRLIDQTYEASSEPEYIRDVMGMDL